jgi:hypothetical protein
VGFLLSDREKLYNSIRKYGSENFSEAEILSSFETEEEAYAAEAKFIVKYDSVKNGLNITSGGGGVGSGANHPNYGQSEKYRAIYDTLPDKQKLALHEPYRGKKNSSESALKGVVTREANGWVTGMKSKHHTDEAKALISAQVLLKSDLLSAKNLGRRTQPLN